MKRIVLAVAVLVTAVLLMAACASATPTPTPTPEPPTPTPTPEPTAPTTASKGETLKPYYAALEALEAYTATLVMQYEPAADSDQAPFTLFFSEERVKGDSPRQRVYVRGLSQVDPNVTRDEATYVFIGDETWFRSGDERFYTTRPSRRRLFLSPEDMIPETAKLESRGPYEAPVNGAAVDYYVIANPDTLFTDNASEPVNPTLLQGDVWIAREKKYIARYVLRIQADDLKLRQDPTPGVLTIEYNVTAVAPDALTIKPPEDGLTLDEVALPGFDPGTFPYPDGAVPQTLVQTRDQQMVVLDLPNMDLADAVAFYEKAFVDAGWSENAADRQEVEDTFVGMTWTKGDATVVLMVRTQPGQEGVQVIASNAPTPPQQ